MTEGQANGPVPPETAEHGESSATTPDGSGETGQQASADSAADAGIADDSALEDIEATLENARRELARTQDRFVRLVAEFDNYKKRTEREKTDLYGRAQADIIAKLLDAVDDLERVADFDESTPSKALLEGVQLVEKKLLTAFENAGLERLNAAGKPFDPATMEALATVQAETAEEDEQVADVFQAGYMFGGVLVRPARVRVKQFED